MSKKTKNPGRPKRLTVRERQARFEEHLVSLSHSVPREPDRRWNGEPMYRIDRRFS